MAAAPSAALALAVVFASAALAPEGVSAPEPTSSATQVVATPTASASTPDPVGGAGAVAGGPAIDLSADPGEAVDGLAGGGASIAGGATGSPGDLPAGGVAGASPTSPADAAATETERDGVDVAVAIDPSPGSGSLSMTVGGSSSALVESDSTAEERRFRGTLPAVTVVDTRPATEIASSAGWYVLASASGFVGMAGQADIGADHLGWTPELLGTAGRAFAVPVAAGPVVSGVLDGGEGLRDAVLLATTGGSSAASAESWAATAELLLAAEPTVAAGSYRSTVTLSLFE